MAAPCGCRLDSYRAPVFCPIHSCAPLDERTEVMLTLRETTPQCAVIMVRNGKDVRCTHQALAYERCKRHGGGRD